MAAGQLNLARAWRPRSFDQIIGQPLPVKILKNSLFLGRFFPVYLFAGQRGCGKTTTARVFAMAVNCQGLPEFQKDPSRPVPCHTCASCVAMAQGKHPDFIEIDAASHTGVDHVRQIIEAASLAPLMGTKRIYLIDEAHMLSKAAFNAFLKILEEPPASVLFMLATTDEHKIVETVRSRCFQLFFAPVVGDTLCAHLAQVCQSENIAYEPDALALIAQESQGCVRDALNVLEQVRLSADAVTVEQVRMSIGRLSDQDLAALVACLAGGNSSADVLSCAQKVSLPTSNAAECWQQIVRVLHAALWIKNDLTPPLISADVAAIAAALEPISLAACAQTLQFFCDQEPAFLRTQARTEFLMLTLVQAWQQLHAKNQPAAERQSHIKQDVPVAQPEPVSIMPAASVQVETVVPRAPAEPVAALAQTGDQNAAWQQFANAVDELGKPVLSTLVRQGIVRTHADDGVLVVHFPARMTFFKDVLEQSQVQWHPLLERFMGAGTRLNAQFVITDEQPVAPVRQSTQQSSSAAVPARTPGMIARPRPVGRERTVDVSDEAKWPAAHMVLRYFPGTITHVEDESA